MADKRLLNCSSLITKHVCDKINESKCAKMKSKKCFSPVSRLSSVLWASCLHDLFVYFWCADSLLLITNYNIVSVMMNHDKPADLLQEFNYTVYYYTQSLSEQIKIFDQCRDSLNS